MERKNFLHYYFALSIRGVDLMGWIIAIAYWLCGIFMFRNSIAAADRTTAVGWYVVLAFFLASIAGISDNHCRCAFY